MGPTCQKVTTWTGWFSVEVETTTSRPALGPTQPIQWVLGGGSSTEIKQPRHEADHSPPPNAEIKNSWSYTPLPHTPSRRGDNFACWPTGKKCWGPLA
jgi:hypothetical protein